MAGIASLFGIGSSRTEISDDEASDISAGEEVVIPVRQEKNGKAIEKAPAVEEESLRVESEKEEDEEDDEEVGEDEFVALQFSQEY